LQRMLVCAPVVVNAGGCVMLNVCVIVQPAGLEIVHVYVPAQSAVAVAPVPPEGAHAYVYVPVPPEATTEAEPVHAPLHSTFTCDCVALSGGGCVMVTLAVATQPLLSVTVTVYVPADKPEAVAPVPPDGAHEYVYVPDPPVAVTVAEPLLPPLQLTFVCAEIVAVGEPAFVMVTVRVMLQPFASVTVTVYEPAPRPVAVAFVPPVGAHE
jgi:hypothetical protein